MHENMVFDTDYILHTHNKADVYLCAASIVYL